MPRIFGVLAIAAITATTLAGCTRTVYVHTPATHSTAPVAAEPSDQATTSAFDYTDAGFTISLKTTSKECFGSAGCNVTVKPVLGVADPSTIPDTASGTLTYEIVGGSDGPVTDTVTLTGSQYEATPTFLSTDSQGSKLTVKITDTTTDPQ